MKKVYLLIPFLFIVMSCQDFLNETLEGTYSDATFYQSAAHAEIAITGVYNATSFNSSYNVLWVFGDVSSDDAVKGGNPGDLADVQFLEQFDYNRANDYLARIWRQYYEGINRANFLLHYIDRIEMNSDRKAEIVGEAKFLRAWFHFNLVNIYGEIPLRIEPALNPGDSPLAKSPVADVYTQIEKDLTEAITGLRVKATHTGGATQGSANGLLAKVRLYQQDWQGALDAITSLETLAVYSLQPVYKNNFIDSTQNNTESIFEIQHAKAQQGLGSLLNQYFSPSQENGYYFDQPTQSFVDEFEVTAGDVVDPRLDYSVGREGHNWVNGEPFEAAWSSTGYLSRKHVQPLKEVPKGTKGDASLNYVYMRYADVLLMKAEALNELNRPTEALDPLNAVRKRARESYLYDTSIEGFDGTIPTDLLPDVAVSGQNAVREAIRHERRVELGMEFHRYFDLMRYGKTAAEAALAADGFSYEANRYYLIPQAELDTNPLITQ